jgi:diguanylate cyclase (GGDEF)-like protein
MTIASQIERFLNDAPENELLGVIYIDIDNFAWHNDGYGHINGDKSLDKLTEILELNINGDMQTWFRVGGDEFIVIIRNESANNTFEIAENIREAFERLCISLVDKSTGQYNDFPFLPNTLTVSAGAIRLACPRINGDWLLQLSATCVEYAKVSGKNKVVSIDMI